MRVQPAVTALVLFACALGACDRARAPTEGEADTKEVAQSGVATVATGLEVSEDGELAVGRFGRLQRAGVYGQEETVSLLLNGRTILRAQDLGLGVSEFVITAGRPVKQADIFLVAAPTGGVACPFHHLIVDVSGPETARVSQPFGTCGGRAELLQLGDRIVVDVRRLSNVEAVSGAARYSYANGVVREEGRQDAQAPAAGRGSALPLELGFLSESDPEEDDGYVRRLEKGYALLAEGRSAPALAEFQGAARIALMEEANTLPWAGEAEALCRLGRKAEGRATLADFTCAVELTARRRTCASLEVAELTPRGGPGFPARCHAELCAAEIVRGTLDGAPIAENRRVSDGLTRLAGRLAKQCAG